MFCTGSDVVVVGGGGAAAGRLSGRGISVTGSSTGTNGITDGRSDVTEVVVMLLVGIAE